jgi:hypothetical protein
MVTIRGLRTTSNTRIGLQTLDQPLDAVLREGFAGDAPRSAGCRCHRATEVLLLTGNQVSFLPNSSLGRSSRATPDARRPVRSC